MKSADRNQLIDDLLDGAIASDDFARLESLLESDAAARKAYYDRLHLHTALEAVTDEATITEFPTPGRTKWLWASSIAAALLVIATLVRTGTSSDQPGITEPGASGFAVITDQIGASWDLTRGDLLPDGPLTLASGTVQLEFFSGVTVLLDGASTFEVLSDMEMRVDKGKVLARVPPLAEGFRINTGAGNVVDLGTEFALEVEGDYADLHVIDGEVEWHPTDQSIHSMTTGESIRWTQGKVEQSPRGASNFADMADVEKMFELKRDERRTNWQRHAEGIDQDARVLAYYSMASELNSERQLRDRTTPTHNGTIVRAVPVTDRWGHSQSALDFTPMGSRVRVDIPETLEALTFYCWVKIDSLDRWYNSLFLTDGHELNEPHWQIMNDGRLFFSVKAHDRKGPNSPDKQICYSPSFWDPSLSGQWLQVATTFDSASGQVVHYVNGEAISRETIRDAMRVDQVRIGAASIGNWSEPERNDPHFAVRNLNGAIDEFILFNTALSPEEIDKLYQAGKP